MKFHTCVLVGAVLCGLSSCSSSRGSSAAPSGTPAPASTPWLPPAAWDALCPASGVTEPVPLRAPESVQFEPSAAATWDGRVLVLGDKQAHAWWWTPGATGVERDPAWEFKALPPADANACCSAAPGPWGTDLKRQKAMETCGDHRVAAGTAVPWLKAEAASSSADGLHVLGNMGFGCADNGELRRLPGPGMAPVPDTNVNRDAVLKAAGARDVRVESVAVVAGSPRVVLVGIRQQDVGAGDALVTRVVVFGAATAVADILPPEGSQAAGVTLGLSDMAVMPDGHVVMTASQEDTLDGVRYISGQVWRSVDARPWEKPGAWKTALQGKFQNHKPEAVVALSATCVAVIFDDDEKYKMQNRELGGAGNWDSQDAYVAYARISPR